MNQPPPDQWRRNLSVLRLTGFSAYLGFVFAGPLLPLYLRDLLGGQTADVAFWAGLSFAVSPLLGAITGPFWGQVADRIGPKLMLSRALFAIGCAMALTAAATDVLHVFGTRVLIGALGGFSVASIAAVAASTPRRELSRALGSFQAAQTLGLVAGPIAGGLLADAFGVRLAFLISGLIFIPPLLLVQRFYRDIPAGTLDGDDPPPPRLAPPTAHADPRESARNAPATPATPTEPPSRASLADVLRTTPALLLVMASLYAFNFAEAGIGPLMPLYLAAAGAPPESLATVAGATVSGASLGAAASAYALGRLGARIGVRAGLLLLFPLGAALWLGLWLVDVWWQLILGRMLIGAMVGGGPTLVYAAAGTIVPSTQRGAAMGFVTSAGLLGYASGPLAAGAVAQASLGAVFLLNAAVFLLATLALLTLGRRLAAS